MARFFTLQEAEQLLPEVETLVRRAIALKTEFDEAEQDLQNFARRIMLAGGSVVRPSEAVALKQRRDAAASSLKSVMEDLEVFGCLIKDLNIGLLDFPTYYRGREVYLCWRLGEKGISHWHGTDEGFAGRKPIDDDFLAHHRGEPQQ
jgi:hypothetical protein